MSTEVPANQSMMSSPQWDLTFTLHCPDPLYMKLVRYTGVELPNQEFYDDLGINPDSSEPKFTLFPSDSPRVMALQDIIVSHILNHGSCISCTDVPSIT